MSRLTITRACKKKLDKYIKGSLRKGIDDYSGALQEGYDQMLSIANSGNVELDVEYFTTGLAEGNFPSETKNIFAKYKLFSNDNLYAIFVICKDCGGTLRCTADCRKNEDVIASWYDICFHY